METTKQEKNSPERGQSYVGLLLEPAQGKPMPHRDRKKVVTKIADVPTLIVMSDAVYSPREQVERFYCTELPVVRQSVRVTCTMSDTDLPYCCMYRSRVQR